MSWTPDLVALTLVRGFQGAAAHADELNRLDAALGDGDLGGTVHQCALALGDFTQQDFETIAAPCLAAARLLGQVSGSSLVTVCTIALLGAAEWAGERRRLERRELPDMLAAGLAAILALGHVKLGDKTIVDGLGVIGSALEHDDHSDASALVSHRAVIASLVAEIARLKGEPFKAGRGRVYGDAARGKDDPGMVALLFALQNVCGGSAA